MAALPNTGNIGPNTRGTKQNSPAWTGSGFIDGKEYWISAWPKTNSTTGSLFFSLSFTLKTALRPVTNPTAGMFDNDDDDIPF